MLHLQLMMGNNRQKMRNAIAMEEWDLAHWREIAEKRKAVCTPAKSPDWTPWNLKPTLD